MPIPQPTAPAQPASPRRPLRPVLWLSLGLGVLQLGCQSVPLLFQGQSSTPVTVYRNDRFAFEFPHPSQWTAAPAPGNGDGQAFVHPDNPEIEVRGWASFRPIEPGTTPDPQQPRSRFQAPTSGTPLWDCTTGDCAALASEEGTSSPIGPSALAFEVPAKTPGKTVFEPNFVTQSGHLGKLSVEIGFETSTVHLYVELDDREFHWQGTSPSAEFSSYYPLFYSLAQGFQPLEPTHP